LMHACRHIPVLVDLSRDRGSGAEAWLLSYTNPDTCVMMALKRVTCIPKVALCTCSSIAHRADQLARETGLEADDLIGAVPVGGLNHCAAVWSCG